MVREARLGLFPPLIFMSPAFATAALSMSFVSYWRSRIAFVPGLPAVLFLLLNAVNSHGQSKDPPFVAGFERFARHGDLSPADAGNLLVSELNCVACHASSKDHLAPKGGPTLIGAANRFSEKWLREYLTDPADKKSGTTMPHMLSRLDPAQQQLAIRKLVAFLGTQKKAFETVRATGAVAVMHEFWNLGDPVRGRNLYHTVGCVACHQPDPDYKTARTTPTAIDQMIAQLDPEDLQELGLLRAARRVDSVPHGDLIGKYTRQSLTMFLLRPDAIRKGARMPSMRLSPAEAADIAAYLLSEQSSEVEIRRAVNDPVMIEEGRSIFVELQCAQCHEATNVATSKQATAWDDLDPSSDRSCLANPTAGMPRYGLDAAQAEAIRVALRATSSADESESGQLVHHRMLQLNCYACHQRDTVLSQGDKAASLGGVGRYRKPYFEMVEQVDLGDEGRLPPPLTGVGNKLLPKVLKAVFDQRTAVYRRHMKARMPAYHTNAVKDLVEKLPVVDQAGNKGESVVFGKVSDSLLRAGHELSGTGCVECHYYRGESLPGVVGLDLAGITSRVRPEWFHDFVLDPGALKSRTRMPTFFPDGKSNRPDLLDGDVEKQIASLWFYLKDITNQPLPEKIEKVRSQNYELRPTKRPVVLRSFMQDAGTHAIAVGFPEQIHYSFDSEKMRLASAWKGRFLDARGTWFERFTPPADPLGESLVRFPQGPAFAVFDHDDAVWPAWENQEGSYQFRGYRLDSRGVPTFLYRFAQWQIEERIEPMGKRGLRRQWDIKRLESDPAEAGDESAVLNLCVHQATKLQRQAINQVYGDGLQVQLVGDTDPDTETADNKIMKAGEIQQWILPLESKREQKVVVEYVW